MTCGPERDRIADLLASGELEAVASDVELAARLLADGARHIDTARAAADLGDLTGAYQLAYDAPRKSAAALLAVQGLRATSRGGHIAIQDAVQAQFGGSGSPFRAFGRIRRSRNSFEYPDSDRAGPDRADVDDAVKVSPDGLSAARVLIDSAQPVALVDEGAMSRGGVSGTLQVPLQAIGHGQDANSSAWLKHDCVREALRQRPR